MRAELSSWVDRARAGEEVVITERGTPVARLLPVGVAPLPDFARPAWRVEQTVPR
ncbi:MAG: type II toxin-antitoxin system Phd/YefM family antitoxin [Acidimicrobiales bacterium]